MEELYQGLIEALKKNLPDMQVKAVEERLKEYETLICKLKDSESLVKYYHEKLDNAEAKMQVLENDLKNINNKTAELNDLHDINVKREQACEARERSWELEKTMIKLDAQKDINNKMFNLVSQVFHSPVYCPSKEMVMTMKNIHGEYDNVQFYQLPKLESKIPTDHRNLINENNTANTNESTENVIK